MKHFLFYQDSPTLQFANNIIKIGRFKKEELLIFDQERRAVHGAGVRLFFYDFV